MDWENFLCCKFLCLFMHYKIGKGEVGPCYLIKDSTNFNYIKSQRIANIDMIKQEKENTKLTKTKK